MRCAVKHSSSEQWKAISAFFPFLRACYMGATTLLGLARSIYIRRIYGISGKKITKYTVIYGVYIRFWPTLNTPHVSKVITYTA
jgi:hypothetical protein